jgi:tetratricopeptide (TPR) repeat protein
MKKIISHGYVKILIFTYLLTGSDLQGQVKISEEKMNLPTYEVAPPSKVPHFFNNGSTQGAANYIYPLADNDIITDKRVMADHPIVALENEWIKVGVSPEIGGKVYYAIDKTNGHDFIYRNDVVKPGNVGPTGAWVSGGIEWCVLHHHRPSGFLPINCTTTESEDGKKTVWISETEPRHRIRWAIGVSAFPGKSYFEAEVKMVNQTPYTHTFLFWANVATHTDENFQVFFPQSVQFATFHSKNSMTRWPFSTEVFNNTDFTKGVDVSWWKNSTNSNSFFAWDLKEDFMGGYDHGKNVGTVHVGDHNIVKGAKLWEWGSGERGQATEARLTEKSGPYVEIMVGAYSDNQPDYSWIRPGEVKTWKQYWFPIKDIKGLRYANLNGALNLELNNNMVFVGYNSTQLFPKARIIVKNKDQVLLQKDIEISPAKAFVQNIKVDKSVKYTDLYTEMIDLETNQVLLSFQPKETEKKPLPETVKNPPLPAEVKTVEELYLTGKRIEQFYHPRYDEIDYYKEALARDPGDIRTNTAMGNIAMKNGDYPAARAYLSRAIKRLTKDYTRPSTTEALFMQGLVLKELGLYDEAVDTLYRATWDYANYSAAYFELAQISALQGNFAKALAQIDESLSTNVRNTRAIGYKASLQRRLGDVKGALTTLGTLPHSDPLDLRIANEVYLIDKAMGNSAKAEKELSSLNKKMRDFDENYLELAVGYMNDGLYDEAEDVLRRFNGKDPEVNYCLGWILDRKGNKTEAAMFFKAGSSMSTDLCFPFRLEALRVFRKAIEYDPNDGRAYYYIGNILMDKQPEKAIASYEKAVSNDQNLAMAYRNLGWGYNYHKKDPVRAISYYEKAIAAEKTEPVYYAELDNLYELTNSPIDRRLALFRNVNDIVKKRDDSFVRQIMVLTLGGQPEKAVEYLKDQTFSYREGNSRVREVIIDAHLTLGNKYYAAKDYNKALEHYLLAQTPDEEAGSARSGNRDIQVNYFIGLAYEALGQKSKAKAFFTKAANQTTRGTMRYYQGLSALKLGDRARATQLFDALVADGEAGIKQANRTDFFVMFGDREAESTRMSGSYAQRGLGYKGLGDKSKAAEDLKKAVELSVGNLWAKTELSDL